MTRYYKTIPISQLEGELSDEGKEVEKIESEANLYWLIKRFLPKDQPIAKMISEGYTRREIIKTLRVGQHRIENVFKRLQKELKLV